MVVVGSVNGGWLGRVCTTLHLHAPYITHSTSASFVCLSFHPHSKCSFVERFVTWFLVQCLSCCTSALRHALKICGHFCGLYWCIGQDLSEYSDIVGSTYPPIVRRPQRWTAPARLMLQGARCALRWRPHFVQLRDHLVLPTYFSGPFSPEKVCIDGVVWSSIPTGAAVIRVTLESIGKGCCTHRDKCATLRSLLVRMSCEAARISEVLISGTSANDSILTTRCVALHTERAFAV